MNGNLESIEVPYDLEINQYPENASVVAGKVKSNYTEIFRDLSISSLTALIRGLYQVQQLKIRTSGAFVASSESIG